MLERRSQLPIEKAFADRVAERSTTFFKPVNTNDVDSVTFHRELSYLIDAFDSLPWRVDIAFDSTWKAFELETKEVSNGNATDRLKATAAILDSEIVERLCESFPVQSCEYLFARTVTDVVDETADNGLTNRMLYSTDSTIRQLLDHLKGAYGDGEFDSRRKGALLLRRALRGDTLTLGGVGDFRLDTTSRARILISLFLYTTRNERFHGASFSPFLSSAASLRTYTHPFFAFLASYYLLLAVWLEKRPEALGVDQVGLLRSLEENLKTSNDVFGGHWEK